MFWNDLLLDVAERRLVHGVNVSNRAQEYNVRSLEAWRICCAFQSLVKKIMSFNHLDNFSGKYLNSSSCSISPRKFLTSVLNFQILHLEVKTKSSDNLAPG